MRRLGQGGQALLELIFSSSLIAIAVAGAGWILRAEWDRARCAYLVFETTRLHLGATTGPIRFAGKVSLEENRETLIGKSQCGAAPIEQVELVKLEAP